MLHTPLMSGTNAIHGIVLLAACWSSARKARTRSQGRRHDPVIFGTINIVGGFLVTERMLRDVQGARRASRKGEERLIAAWSSDSSET